MANYTEERINDFLNGRAFLWVMIALLALCSWLGMATGRFAATDSGGGIFFKIDLAEALGHSALLSWTINLALLLLTTWLSLLLNKVFTPIRAVTRLFASMFLLLMLALPPVSVQLGVGTLMLAVAVGLMFVLFASYDQRGYSQSRIYIIFALLTTCCLFHYSFLALMVAFALGFFQMHSMGFRGTVAMLLGIATPFWIGFGLGLLDPTMAMAPMLGLQWPLTMNAGTQFLIVALAGVAVLAVVLIVVNSFTFRNYRREIRVYNYFIATLGIVALVAMAADVSHALTYVPLLCWSLSIQLAHTFTINSSFLHRHVFILLIVAAALALWFMQLLWAV